MPRVRRFHIASLAQVNPGDRIALPEEEARHIRVLRLKPGAELDLFDSTGRSASARLLAGALEDTTTINVEIVSVRGNIARERIFGLAVAWPKGKRAAFLVEKCVELGVGKIVPVRFERSVVHKPDESEGLQRLRRIAAEAAKQCGRATVPEISTEQSLSGLLESRKDRATMIALHPEGDFRLSDVFDAEPAQYEEILFLVGPEGGFSEHELEMFEKNKVRKARLEGHILRIETAAIAVCVLAQEMKKDEKYYRP
jgi:16S rRNA (uracil1498-N3)-methyltransferase